MRQQKLLNKTRIQRKRRSRSDIFGTKEKPRLSIFKSNQKVYVQLIDDTQQKTIASAVFVKEKTTPSERITTLSKDIVKKAKDLGIQKMICDRGQYKYHGIVKQITEEIRKEGINI